MSAQSVQERLEVLQPPKRYAVLLNARAKSWTGEVHEQVLRYVPSQDLFLTADFRQAEQTVDKLIAQKYDVIFAGGGDGSIVYLINALERRIRQGRLERGAAPMVGVLKLGTGNALGVYVGAQYIVDDLRALAAGASLKAMHLPMVDDRGGIYPFVGFGWDAEIVNDYDDFKHAVQETALEKYATGLGGYFLSVGSRTIPKAMVRGNSRVRFTNLGAEAFRLDAQGQIVQSYEPGEVLYDGPSRVCSAATIPYWGFKIRMFPFCNLREGFFELRNFCGPIRQILFDLPAFWRGEFPEHYLQDFLVSHVQVDFDSGRMGYQMAGDPGGQRSSVEWKITGETIPLVVPMQ